MSERVRPALRFDTIDDVIDDVRRMQRVGYAQHGNWSLPQICWHVGKIMEPTLKSPAIRSATPEQSARQQGFLAVIRKPGGASTFPAGPSVTPADSLGEEAIRHFIELLERLNTFPDTLAEMGPLGAAPIEVVREAHRLHAAHHLGFLKPKAERRLGLSFADFDAAMADVRQLQKGHIQVGQWTLAQNCFHVDAVTKARLKSSPFPPDTDEQKSRADVLKQILASGRIPRIVAPDFLQPPASADDAAIQSCLHTFERCKTHTNFSPHRLFGTMNDVDSGRHILIHAAHHLSFLVPTQPN